jgi:Fanconi-associated nuclease 1
MEFEIPSAKRVRRLEDADSSTSRGGSESDAEAIGGDIPFEPDTFFGRGAPNQDGDEPGELPPGSQTELESSLPCVKSEKEAFDEYELLKKTEDNGGKQSDLEKRLGDRSWEKGKSSIYVDAFNLALETVLNEEAHLFDDTELAVFEQWKGLVYESQYLYVSDLCQFALYFRMRHSVMGIRESFWLIISPVNQICTTISP